MVIKINRAKRLFLSVNSLIIIIVYIVFIVHIGGVSATNDVFSTFNVVLLGTRTFTIDVSDGNVPSGIAAHGTVFYWGVSNEIDKNYDYFIIGIKYVRSGGFGFTPSNSLGGLMSIVKVYDGLYRTVYTIDYEPVFKVPLTSGTVTVGTGGAYVSFSLELHGYDYGDPIPLSYNTYYDGFNWRHYYTKADQDWWNKKAGAVLVKVPEVNGYLGNWGEVKVYLYYYVWNVWTGYVSGWYPVSWNEGGQGTPFKLTDPTPGN